MIDALLSPFSQAHQQRYIRSKIDHFYQNLTKDSLTSTLRKELLGNPGEDVLLSELQQASRGQSALRQLFDDYAVEDTPTQCRVWTEKQFAAFITHRLGELSAVPVLWRCFCYNAFYPFFDFEIPFREVVIDLKSWLQAVTLLATAAVRNVGRNMAGLNLYGDSSTPASRMSSYWRRFRSLAIAGSVPEHTAGNNFVPADTLEEVARVATAQLPIPMPFSTPDISEVRLRVQGLVQNDEGLVATASTKYEVPYQDMIAIVSAILCVKQDSSNESILDDKASADPSIESEKTTRMAIAASIINAAGIDGESSISFSEYAAFSEKFRYKGFATWSFDLEISKLWRALFSTKRIDTPSTASMQSSPTIVQALRFLAPVEQDSAHEFMFRQATISYASLESDLSCEKVLQALKWPYSPKLVVIYGNTSDDQIVTFAILTSSPLWCEYKTGNIDDFFVGDSHFLLQLAPKAHVLTHFDSKIKYADLVDTAKVDQISFGRSGNSSGLTLDFDASVATFSYAPEQAGGYHEIKVRPGARSAEAVEADQAWETVCHMRKIEVLSLPSGVDEDLSIPRAERR